MFLAPLLQFEGCTLLLHNNNDNTIAAKTATTHNSKTAHTTDKRMLTGVAQSKVKEC